MRKVGRVGQRRHHESVMPLTFQTSDRPKMEPSFTFLLRTLSVTKSTIAPQTGRRITMIQRRLVPFVALMSLAVASFAFGKDVYLPAAGSAGVFHTDARIFNPSQTK